MGRYERKVFFERLCELRSDHDRALPDDRDVVMTLAEALVWAEGLARRSLGVEVEATRTDGR